MPHSLFVYPYEVEKPLTLRFQVEQAKMLDLMDNIRALRLELRLLDALRKETKILAGHPEEQLETIEPDLQILQDQFKKLICEHMTEKFSYVGQVGQRVQGFAFSSADPNLKAIDYEESMLKSQTGKKIDEDTYTYNFIEEKEHFEETLIPLKESLARYKETAVDFQTDTHGTIASRQFAIVINIAESKLEFIEKEGVASLDILKSIVKTDELEDEFWKKLDQEKDNFALDIYQKRLYKVSQLAKNTLNTEIQDRLNQLHIEFNQGEGSSSTGYLFLSDEWKEKVSFEPTQKKFDHLIQKFKDKVKATLKPLFETVKLGMKDRTPIYKLIDGWVEKK